MTAWKFEIKNLFDPENKNIYYGSIMLKCLEKK